MPFFVYMLASRRHGTLYLGMTNDLGRRVHEHRTKATLGFTSLYGVDRLVWSETYDQVLDAIAREKQLKNWRRDWTIRLIEENNPEWADLYETLNDCAGVPPPRALRPGLTHSGLSFRAPMATRNPCPPPWLRGHRPPASRRVWIPGARL